MLKWVLGDWKPSEARVSVAKKFFENPHDRHETLRLQTVEQCGVIVILTYIYPYLDFSVLQ